MNEIPHESVAVIGGAGFIGSHLVDRLVSLGRRVIVIDNLSTGRRENVNPAATLHETEAADPQVPAIFEAERCGLVYLLAANTNVPLSVQNPVLDFQSLSTALRVMEVCRHSHARTLVFTSSGFIYGNCATRPIREDEPFKPVSPYAISKQAIEHYLEFYRRVYGLNYVVLRLATVYGPRQVCGALADYIRKLAAGQQAEIYGDGRKTRDYVYVQDVVDALVTAPTLPAVASPVFNIGTGQETPLLEAYRKIARLLGKPAEPVLRPDRQGELDGYSLCWEKAGRVLRWEPKFAFEEGLRLVLSSRGLLPVPP